MDTALFLLAGKDFEVLDAVLVFVVLDDVCGGCCSRGVGRWGERAYRAYRARGKYILRLVG